MADNEVEIKAVLKTDDLDRQIEETKRMLNKLAESSAPTGGGSGGGAASGAMAGGMIGAFLGVATGEESMRIADTVFGPLKEALSDVYAEWHRVAAEAMQIKDIGVTYKELSREVDEAASAFGRLSDAQQRSALGLGEGEMELKRYHDEIKRAQKEIEELEKTGFLKGAWQGLVASVTGGDTFMDRQLAALHKLAEAEGVMKGAAEEDRQRREDEFFESRQNAQRFHSEEDQRQYNDRQLEEFMKGWDHAGEEMAKAEARAFEKAVEVNEKFHSDRLGGKGLGGDRQEFRSTMLTDAMEVSRQLMTANLTPHEARTEAFQEKALAQTEQTNKYMSDNVNATKAVLGKIENVGGLTA